MTSPRTPCALPMTGVIAALPVNHQVGGSLENLILKISSRVNDHHCLWGKLIIDDQLSSMIRYRLNATIDQQVRGKKITLSKLGCQMRKLEIFVMICLSCRVEIIIGNTDCTEYIQFGCR